MTKLTTLKALLRSQIEPKYSEYDEAANKCTGGTKSNALPEWSEEQDIILLDLVSHSNRLACYMRRVHLFQSNADDETTKEQAAATTTQLLLDVVPPCLDLLQLQDVVNFLVPGLTACLLPRSPPPTLQQVAEVVAGSSKLVQLLISDPAGSQVFGKWVSKSSTTKHQPNTLRMWTISLIAMVATCNCNHGVSAEVRQWTTLRSLIEKLQDLHWVVKNQTSTLLKDARTVDSDGHFEPRAAFTGLDDTLVNILQDFHLPAPSSDRLLVNVIEQLEGEKTLHILSRIAKTFPCKICHGNVQTQPLQHFEDSMDAGDSAPTETEPRNCLELLGKAIGIWKIRLSGTALKSLQLLISSGFSDTIQQRLVEMAEGIWVTTLAGDHRQRNRLKVPLANTKCGRNTFILWQVDVAMADGVAQQVITVWEVGDSTNITKAIDKVCTLQRSYTPETIRRCRQKPNFLKGIPAPVQFEGADFGSSMPPDKAEDLDIRVLDHDTIEMANKFYAFSEPLIRSVFSDNMTAELPLDLSKDEECVIAHFHSSTLILGRSGTGKTTCLIYKLVAKYLAGTVLKAGRLRRQVLITRSTFLADKIRVHVQRLIETLTKKSFILEPLHEREDIFSGVPTRDAINTPVHLLQDASFPLICTFDEFMRLLETSMRLIEREGTFDTSRTLVDYQSFELDYWPRFAQNITKGLPVALVFAEIMGVIKGSARSLESLVALNQEEYVARSRRLAPTFVLDDERNRIYGVFESYEALKASRCEVDDVDRVVHVLKTMRRDANVKALLGSAFDEIYIDEVQDQRTLDIGLLLNLVSDCRGFHFAGDTAQAISQESTFRFADIKALFYDHFIRLSNAANQAQLAQPTMFALSKNYRSHQGILALASQVMDWLWKGFPDTIDKLGPEIGQYTGPRPVMFLRCEPSVLTSNNVGQGNASEKTAEFGAEQVILVHDDAAKARLQAEVGNVALILTILQSKGMEFDDVILWNFFTDCPYPAGLRALSALSGKEATAAFDARKHLRLCSILKSLYVAVTRSRIQLFLMESGDHEIAPVEKVLYEDTPVPLIDLTRPHEADFNAKLQALRPGRVVDRHRWALRGEQLMHSKNYRDALLCFEKANDEKNATIAKGNLAEDEGRRCEAQGNQEESRQHFEVAIEHFLRVDFLREAVNIYARLARFHEAAELLHKHGALGLAAEYYVKAQFYPEAADCYHYSGQHDKAAATLRQGGYFDELVAYVRVNREHMSAHTYQSYGRLGKLLLKQGKISINHRKDAIHNLGSLQAQESCFIEYRMLEDLAELYLARERHVDLLKLHLQQGDLEKALSVPFNNETAADIPEDRIFEIVDYVAAKQLVGQLNPPSVGTGFDLPEVFKTNTVRGRLNQWNMGLGKRWAPLAEGKVHDQTLMELEHADIKQFISLQIIFDNNALKSLPDFEMIPFEAFHVASQVILNLALGEGEQAKVMTLLLAGVWQTDEIPKKYVPLAWSPLCKAGNEDYQGDAFLEARKGILEQIASAFLTLDMTARDLWKSKWPVQCIQHLSRGKCSKQNCSRRHEHISKKECDHMIEELIEMSGILCYFTQVYYARVMPERFQEQFLPTRRYWLERLLRRLTYISSLEQDPEAILKAQSRLFSDKETNVGSALEGLIYHRLGKDWTQRASFSWVLENLQFATQIGSKCRDRFFRALHSKLRFSGVNAQPTIQHLCLLRLLETDAKAKNPPFFRTNLQELLNNMENIRIQEFSNMHAVTATLEAIATHLIFTISSAAFAIPQSWAYFYLPTLMKSAPTNDSLAWTDKHIYQECLVYVINCFCHLLSRLDDAMQDSQGDFSFCFGGRVYDRILLQQRNLELIAIILINLSGNERGFGQAWTTFRTVLTCRFVGSTQFDHKTIEELALKLARSFVKYADKNKILIVSRGVSQNHLFRRLRQQPSVKEVGLDSIRAILPQQISTTATTEEALPIPDGSQAIEYTGEELKAVIKIKAFWRQHLPALLQRRKYLSTPGGQIFKRYSNLCARRRSTPKLYIVLLSSGVELTLKIDAVQVSLQQQHESIMRHIEGADPSEDAYEALDGCLQRVHNLESELKSQVSRMSASCLTEVLEKGDLRELRQILDIVKASTAAAESGLAQIVTDMRDM